jgi:hypothetical protein
MGAWQAGGRGVAILALAGAFSAGAAFAAEGPGERPKAVDVEIAPANATQELRLTDGSRLYGRVVDASGEQVVFVTVSGVRLELETGRIAGLKLVKGEVAAGEFQQYDPNETRLIFGPTARSVRRGKGYLGVYEVVLPFVQFGVTDRLSFGGGSPLIFGSEDDGSRLFWLTPKIQLVNRARTTVAVGLLHLFATGEKGSVGIAYGVVTQGGSNAAVTLGVGCAYARGFDHDTGAAIVMIGGEKRVARNLKLITENYLWKGGDGLASAGVRFFGERLSADLALVVPLQSSNSLVLPLVNFVWHF